LGVSAGSGVVAALIIAGAVILIGAMGLMVLYILKMTLDIDIFKDSHLFDLF
jgi:hypothetical protein